MPSIFMRDSTDNGQYVMGVMYTDPDGTTERAYEYEPSGVSYEPSVSLDDLRSWSSWIEVTAQEFLSRAQYPLRIFRANHVNRGVMPWSETIAYLQIQTMDSEFATPYGYNGEVVHDSWGDHTVEWVYSALATAYFRLGSQSSAEFLLSLSLYYPNPSVTFAPNGALINRALQSKNKRRLALPA